MNMFTITSRTNEKIKAACRLRDSSRQRKSEGLFFIEGARLCADAASSTEVVRLLITPRAREKYKAEAAFIEERAKEIYEINTDCALKLADTASSQEIFCICKTLDKTADIDKIYGSDRVIALENIQDPANLGAIARTAEALGIGAMALCGCCDIYNQKAQRASMGSLLRLRTAEFDNIGDIIDSFKQRGFACLASTPSREAEKITAFPLEGRILLCQTGQRGHLRPLRRRTFPAVRRFARNGSEPLKSL